jgi:hypothetical protein
MLVAMVTKTVNGGVSWTCMYIVAMVTKTVDGGVSDMVVCHGRTCTLQVTVTSIHMPSFEKRWNLVYGIHVSTGDARIPFCFA